ncbi:facilitated trehalose transporter Tret1 [Leptinotarsa decemlineata]|uniref:facilitated trehalose transporter Tret1 n=1 Tax=Leptinotarsa decemlineata TaxID=7539 RepID=UPI003D307B7D
MDKNRRRFQYLATISVNWMTFVGTTGYAWTSPYIPKLSIASEENPLSKPITVIENSWITSLFSVGCICGPIIAGVFVDKLGKKKTLILLHTPIMISNVMLIFANSLEEFYISRFLLGVGSGCVYSVIPTYVAEICDKDIRGAMSMISSVVLIISISSVVIMGPYLSISTFSIICLIPSILFLLTFGPFIPESPYDLVLRGKLVEAKMSLSKFRQTTDVQKEFFEIVSSIEETRQNVSFKDMMQSKVIVKSLLITLGLLFFQQFSGSSAIVAYQQTIFDSTDSAISGGVSVIIVSVVQLIPALIASYLIDKLGRKKLLLISQMGMITSLGCIGTYFHLQVKNYDLNSISWLPLISLLAYMVFYRFGLSPIPYTIVGEIFPVHIKAKLSASVIVIMFMFCLWVTFAFPFMFDRFGTAWTFWIFAIIGVASCIFIKVIVPETKGKTFSEIQIMLGEGKK